MSRKFAPRGGRGRREKARLQTVSWRKKSFRKVFVQVSRHTLQTAIRKASRQTGSKCKGKMIPGASRRAMA